MEKLKSPIFTLVTYTGNRIKAGFAISGENPALNIRPSSVTRLVFLKTGKHQVI
jgi:hypothetical protein